MCDYDLSDQFRPPPRPVDKPFRCCIADVFKGYYACTDRFLLSVYIMLVFTGQGSGFNVSGRLESGHVQVGQSVLIQPANEVATVKGMYVRTVQLIKKNCDLLRANNLSQECLISKLRSAFNSSLKDLSNYLFSFSIFVGSKMGQF